MKLIVALAVFMLAGCTQFGGAFRPETSAGIVGMGNDQFVTSRTGASFTSLAELKANVLRDAGEFCRATKREIQVSSFKETPMTIGVYPTVEVTFSCK